ncbi:RodZ domain-containing protein [Celeribacter marinus]
MIGRWSKPPVVEVSEPRSFDDFELRLGDVMRGERATQSKSLLDVQRELKIKATYISAIENSDPNVFETQGFIAGYVRSYARYLGLDPDWAFERFCAESGFAVAHGMAPEASSKRAAPVAVAARANKDPFSDPNASFVPRPESFLSKVEPGAIGSTAVLLALVGVIGFGGWSILNEIQKVQLSPVDQTPGLVAEIAPMPSSQVLMAAVDEGVGIAAPSADAFNRLYRPQALDVPVLVPRDGPIATLDPRAVGSLGDESAEERLNAMSGLMADAVTADANGIAPVQVVEQDAAELALVAVNATWVRVSSAGGTVLFEKILNAGERYVLPATEDAPVLRTGNAGGVYFAVNGQAYGPAGGSGSVVKNIALSVASVSEAFQPVDLAANSGVAEMFRVAQNDAILTPASE